MDSALKKTLIGERNSALYALERAVKELKSTRAALIRSHNEGRALAQNVRDLEDLYADALEQVDAKNRELEEARIKKEELRLKQQHLMDILSDQLLPRSESQNTLPTPKKYRRTLPAETRSGKEASQHSQLGWNVILGAMKSVEAKGSGEVCTQQNRNSA